MSRDFALSHLSFLALLICGACGSEPRILPLSASSLRPGLVAAPIAGRVIDADVEEPIPLAQVTTVYVCYPRQCGPVDLPYSTIANEHGMFGLTANLPQNWWSVKLKVTRPGYEPTDRFVEDESAMNAVLRAYRSITLRPGESVRVRVLFQETCGFEGIPCRPIFIDAAAGESIDLEVSPVQNGDVFGVMIEPFPLSFPPLETQLTVRRGVTWIVRSVQSSGEGMAIVVARRR